MANETLRVLSTSTFDEWRQKYNELTLRTEYVNTIGELSAIDPGIPEENKNSFVDALNYVYQQRISEGQPMENSSLTGCFVPPNSSFYFGGVNGYRFQGNQTSLKISKDGQTIMYFDEDKIGVGIEDPNAEFDVDGTSKASVIRVENPTFGKGLNIYNAPVSTENTTIIDSDSQLIINVGDKEVLLGAGGGKVGVGYSQAEDLEETFNVFERSIRASFSVSNLNSKMRSEIDSTGIHNFFDALEYMTVKPNGYIGLGNTNPTYKLHITGDAYADDVIVGNKILAGSTEFINITSTGKTDMTLADGSVFKVGNEVVINEFGEINVDVINMSADNITETQTRKFLNNTNLNNLLASTSVSRLTINSTGTLQHGSTTIVNIASKVPGGVLDASTSHIYEGNNLYFTQQRVVDAINANPVETVKITNILTLPSYETVDRPTVEANSVIIDSTLNLPVFFDGTDWKDFAGNIV